MGKVDPAYAAARRALGRHMWRHHDGATGEGRLEQRISDHDDLHYLARLHGIDLGHQHEPLGGDENLFELAHRLFQEGDRQHGATNTSQS